MSPTAEDPAPQQMKSPPGSESAADHAPAQTEPASTDVASTTASALPPVRVPVPDAGYTLEGVPTLEGVREKIETRFGTALGATELAEDTPEGNAAAQQFEARQKAAADRLEEIRSSMRKPGRG